VWGRRNTKTLKREAGSRKEVLSPSSLRKEKLLSTQEKKKERGGREGVGKGKNHTQL